MGDKQKGEAPEPKPEAIEPYDPAQAVEAHIQDHFGFETIKEDEPTEFDKACEALAQKATNLVSHYLVQNGMDRAHPELRREWEANDYLELPTVEVDDKKFRLTVTRDPEEDTLQFNLARPIRTPNGFTIIKEADIATLVRDIDLPKDSLKMEDQLSQAEQASEWLTKYTSALKYKPEVLEKKTKTPLVRTKAQIEASEQAKLALIDRQRKQKNKNRIYAAICAVGAIVSLAGIKAYRDLPAQRTAAMEASHAFPDSITAARIGQFGIVGYGDTLDQAILDDSSEFTGTGPDKLFGIDVASPNYHLAHIDIDENNKHTIQAFPPTLIKANSCVVVAINGLRPDAEVKLASTKKSITDSLTFHVDRAEAQFCAPKEQAVTIDGLTVFVEITNP